MGMQQLHDIGVSPNSVSAFRDTHPYKYQGIDAVPHTMGYTGMPSPPWAYTIVSPV